MLITLTLAASLLTSGVFGWEPTGNQLAGGVVNVARGASDGVGGALVLWTDYNRESTNSRDVAAQRISVAGGVSPGWPIGGRLIADSTTLEAPDAAAAGTAGDAFLLWHRSYNDEDLYLTHALVDGAIDPAWPAYGLGVAVGPASARTSMMVPDGSGGVFLSWHEEAFLAPTYATRTARLLRVLPSGGIAPGWPAGGLLIASAKPGAEIRQIVPDGAGGCFVTWMQNDSGVGNFARAKRILADGTPAPGWPTAGVLVCEFAARQFPTLDGCAIADGTGGIYVAWDDDREDPHTSAVAYYGDIFMTRLLADGTRAVGWPATGLPIHVGPGAQWDARMCTDGAGGALVVWTDRNSGNPFLSRVTPSGALAAGWQVGGDRLCSAPGTAENVRLASDGAGGAYAGWSNYTGDYHAIAQHMRSDATLAPGWVLAGAPLVDLPIFHDEQYVSIFPSTPGSAIMTWADCRDGVTPCSSIRAQKLVTDGLVPTALALQSVEADAHSVRLAWWGSSAAEGAFVVERSADGEAWTRLGLANIESAERLTYEDREVVAGQRLAYRLLDASGRVVVAAAWVEVPQVLEFALAGARPNPARLGALTVELSLAQQASGTLELLDLAGRRVAWRDLASLGPGRHTLPFPETASLAPGMHWLRLRQGARETTARVVLTR